MLSMYIKIFIRTLSRQKMFSFINIAGLAIGIACFIVLSLFVLDEAGFDDYNKNKENIYRVLVHLKFRGTDQTNAKASPPLGPALRNTFPEVVNYARIGYTGNHTLRFNEKIFVERDVYTADSTYFDLFTLPFLYGNSKDALRRPNTLVISETASRKYFGDVNPVGKTFAVDDSLTWMITGVMKDYPGKSHFSCNFLLSASSDPYMNSQDWLNGGITTYLLLKDGVKEDEFNNKMKKMIRAYVGPMASKILGISFEEFLKSGNKYEYKLQPLSAIYLRSQSDYDVDSNTEWGNARTSNITYSYIFMAVGVFILLIAVFNFMNLATAKSENRAREVGIKKALGSDRKALIAQFILESILTCMLAVSVSILLVNLVLPAFSNFVSRELSLSLFSSIYSIPVLIAFACIVGILAGSYPAFYLSSFQSAHILKSASGGKSRKSRIRSLLVIFQFAISISLIIGTIVIKDQLHFILNKDLGFNKDSVLSLLNGSSLKKNVKIFQQEISNIPEVESSTASSLMFAPGIPGNGYIYEGMTGEQVIPAQMLDIDYDFAKTYMLQMKSGRFFEREFSTDSGAVVINETMARNYMAGNPVGRTLFAMRNETGDLIPFRIIGIVKDFNYESLHKTVRPLVLHLSSVRQAATVIAVRLEPKNVANTINKIERIWNKYSSDEKMFTRFLDENIARMYESEQKIASIITIFAVLAIIIACLGLFGLVSFVTEQRTKEIGIRKVLGASVFEIIVQVAKDFAKWVLLANIISWPAAYYILNNWLNNFAYRTQLNWMVFVAAGIIALIIAIATVCAQVIKVATRNPVTSLRYE